MNQKIINNIKQLQADIALEERISGMYDSDPELGDPLYDLLAALYELQDANPRESAYIHYADFASAHPDLHDAAVSAMSALEDGADVAVVRIQFRNAVKEARSD